MPEHVIAGQSGAREFRRKYGQLRNWGRWGPEDQKGAVNLITPAKVQSAAATNVALEAGDALLIHCGRDDWETAHARPYGSPAAGYDLRPPRPGLHASCLEF